MRYPYRRVGLAAASAAFVAALTIVPFGSAGAQAANPAASAYGARVQVGGTDVVPPTPEAAVATRPGDDTDTVIDIPADPIAINGTLTATANSHGPANIPTGLTVVQQSVAGPYHGRGLAEIEDVGVVYGVAGTEVPLLGAAAVRAEAAVVCGATPKYTANSEVIDLEIGGTDIPLNAPLSDLVDAISGVLTDSGLSAVADVQRNVVTQIAGGGIAVDALVVKVLSAAGATPLAEVRLAHAEVTAAACAALPQCSDGADNDTDGKIDIADPGCHSDGNPNNAASYVPSDNTEAETQCSDNADNDADGKVDIADPGCHSDGNAANAASYVPSDDNEKDDAVRAALLPRTGGDASLPLMGAGLATAATLAARLRRRLAS